MNKKTIRDIAVANNRVLVRVDYNVPLDKATGKVADSTRIRASLDTIRYLFDRKARVILMSHLGRPDGKVVESARLRPVAEELSKLIGKPVAMAPDCIGPEVEKIVADMKAGDVLLLENLRFHPEEEKNNPDFAKELAKLGEIYVNDAFGTAHRAHASTAGVAAFLPAVSGFLMEAEISNLGKAMQNPKRPFVAATGGAKVSDKVLILQNLIGKVDKLLVGGGMACTFLKAQGLEIGKSLLEQDRIEDAKQIMAAAGAKLVLPEDVIIAERPDASAEAKTVAVDKVPTAMMILDIGPKTAARFAEEIRRAGTVLWNGPMGVFEVPQFAEGTRALVKAMAESNAITVVGGGETVTAVQKMGFADKMTHVSTGGGASLEFLEGRTLPGVAALNDK